MILKTRELFDLNHSIAGPMLKRFEYPHTALPQIGDMIAELSLHLDNSFKEISRGVFAADDAEIWGNVMISGPAIIGHKAEIRPGAFIRGNVIIGDGAVIGNSTEIKNSIIFEKAQLPHYNYVGDSIIGYRAHMGAGSIASNLRLDKKAIVLKSNDERLNSGLRKIGVFLGDNAEIGCGTILCPGCIIGRGAMVLPLVSVIGTVPEGTVYDGHSFTKRQQP